MLDPAILTVAGRVLERILIVLAGIFALWLAHRLFTLNLSSRSTAEVSGHGFSFKAERIGPGIFFAGFATVLLVYAMVTRIDISTDDERHNVPPMGKAETSSSSVIHKQKIAAFGPSPSGEVPVSLKAVNTLLSVGRRLGDGASKLQGNDYAATVKAIPYLSVFQKMYVDEMFGNGTFDMVMMIEMECAKNSERCQSFNANDQNVQMRAKVSDILGARLD